MLLSTGLAVHAMIGNFCMMPMAFARDMPAPYEEHMEMTMTPVFPMSSVHCEHCAKVHSSGGDESQQQSGCSGHCFSQAR
ncbi:MAG: hypothetical protein AAB489_01180, partial [Patescibacteria group bacterium]